MFRDWKSEPSTTKFSVGDRVKMNLSGLSSFPRRKGCEGTVIARDAKRSGTVVVKWDKFAKPQKVSSQYLRGVIPPRHDLVAQVKTLGSDSLLPDWKG